MEKKIYKKDNGLVDLESEGWTKWELNRYPENVARIITDLLNDLGDNHPKVKEHKGG